MKLHKKYQQLVMPKDMPPPEGKGEQAGSLTSNEATPDHSDQPSVLSIGVGTANHMDTMCPFPINRPTPSYICKHVPELTCITAAHDKIP